jgi:hypothetical protein
MRWQLRVAATAGRSTCASTARRETTTWHTVLGARLRAIGGSPQIGVLVFG